jgi:hypothetical protein
MATASLFAGCATTTPKPVKETLEKPGIIEEDIRDDDDGDRPQEERIPDRPSVQLPAQPEFEDSPGQRPPGLQDRLEYPSTPDYSDQKQPRRFIWRDRENGRKSWKSAPDDDQ